MSDKKILLSGVQPSGRPHIGNYFGMMKQFLDLQDSYKIYAFIADLHALTTMSKKHEEIADNTEGVLLDFLAIGLDPKKTLIYKQSDVPQVTELAWIFSCLTTMPYLMRAHAFKDAEAKNKEINVGVFNYPVLQAADILIQDADVVPVGQDQRQHIEISRDIAEKFNNQFGETFKLPEVRIVESVAIVPGTDGQKMSKSYGNTIPLFAGEKELRPLVMSIKTDSKGVEEPKNPEECNVFALHKLFSIEQLPELKRRYVEGGIGYKESKEILAENMNKYLAPFRERREQIATTDDVITVLRNGADIARNQAKLKMERVRKAIGVDL